jgi:small-conductance mechanosensitive channel
MTLPSAGILDQAGAQLGGFLPRLGGALALLVLGILLARLLASLLLRALRSIGVDAFSERVGAGEVLHRAGLGRSLSVVVAVAIRVAMIVVVVFAALSLLGLQFLSESLNRGVLVMPKLLIAGALLLTGVVLGGFVRERVERVSYQLDFPIPLGAAAQAAVVSIFAITAAAQVAISTIVLLILVAIILSGVVATFALAFGLGGRDFARAVSAGRYARGAFEVGQDISLGEIRGRISAIDSASTVIDGGEGRRVRIPNHLLLASIVTVHTERPARESLASNAGL